jgi:hypothetical protein
MEIFVRCSKNFCQEKYKVIKILNLNYINKYAQDVEINLKQLRKNKLKNILRIEIHSYQKKILIN